MKNNSGKKERYFILARQVIYLCIFIAAIIGFIVSITKSTTLLTIFVLPLICILSFFLFLHSLLLSCKVYKYKEKTIIVYAGHWNHYIKVNDMLLDEHRSFTKWFTIHLSGICDGDIFEAKITNFGRISLKINNQLYKQK